jgi:hypothetical protein
MAKKVMFTIGSGRPVEVTKASLEGRRGQTVVEAAREIFVGEKRDPGSVFDGAAPDMALFRYMRPEEQPTDADEGPSQRAVGVNSTVSDLLDLLDGDQDERYVEELNFERHHVGGICE